MGREIYTIGYGGWRLTDFIEVLRGLSIQALIDVRRKPKSTLPGYSGGSLARALAVVGIAYIWIPELGGYRRFGVDVEDYGIAKCFSRKDLRAYATYISKNSEVKPYLERLVEIASRYMAVIMCSERDPWMCHRKILSDYLLSKGFRVVHILDKESLMEHRPSECAVVKNGVLEYL